MKPLIYQGKVFHKRFSPIENSFLYRAVYIRFDIDKVEELKSIFFSVDRFNLMSFYRCDHGHKSKSKGQLRQWATHILEKSGIVNFKGRIELQTFPRMLGFVFLPVSFWYCYEDDNKEASAIICEVNNTFGESFNYVVTAPMAKRKLNKEFHVSPFFDVKGNYQFDFTKNEYATINYEDKGRLIFTASLYGKALEWKTLNILGLFILNPFFTFAVVFLIHYQALKLFLKRVKFYKKPQPPREDINYECY